MIPTGPDSRIDSTNGGDRAAASLGANMDGSLSLKLMNLLMPIFSMSLARISLHILSMLCSKVLSLQFDNILKFFNASIRIDASFVLMKNKSEKILGPLLFVFIGF